MVQSGLALTVGSPIYPRRWVEHLGPGAPPALYVRGDISLLQVKSFAAVGSRQPPTTALRAAIDITFLAQELGYMPTSGGAPGIDRTISSAGSYIEIWPCGLGIRWGAYKRAAHSSLQMSLWPPREQFSTAAAMERNALVYAISDAAFVAHARFRQGGTWHGATDALRKRLTRIVVGSSEWPKEDEAARKALLGLGAQPLNSFTPEGLSTAIEAEPLQPWLPTFAPESTSERALGAY
jgi:predicted Rossmann fold nucleotide-binding protein DprA/Smf involved in DNA uptake